MVNNTKLLPLLMEHPHGQELDCSAAILLMEHPQGQELDCSIDGAPSAVTLVSGVLTSLMVYLLSDGLSKMSPIIPRHWNIWSPVGGGLGRIRKCGLGRGVSLGWTRRFQKSPTVPFLLLDQDVSYQMFLLS